MDYYFIGDAELLTAFRFVGVEGSSVVNPEEAKAAFLKITQAYDGTAGTVLPGGPDCRVLIITEEVADWLGDDLTQWQLSGRYPLVVEIPGSMGRLEGRKTLVDSIREAIGIRV
ncbi:V-type ATP synthase subunit F [Breznakiella homolactica]|uniref:ATPase V n=1 Tax=Breznakiella homolactica TaxID=2798577 RepID=A0A7T7XRP6_9SPIR|nr:V-type ATP synthase subunit F [Breznakiella homolactica]QQO11228.1 ATPase V [Breznakiella homolactica]